MTRLPRCSRRSDESSLAERRERLGEQAGADVQAAWAKLIPRVQEAAQSGK
jgi:hypothetical protein